MKVEFTISDSNRTHTQVIELQPGETKKGIATKLKSDWAADYGVKHRDVTVTSREV